MKHCWQLRLQSNCNYCLNKDEDMTHILHCVHEAAKRYSKEVVSMEIPTIINMIEKSNDQTKTNWGQQRRQRR